MKTTLFTAVATVLTLAVAGVAQAQTYPGFSSSYGAAVTAVPNATYGGGWSHSSTAEEGALRGWAELNRGAGEYNYYSSLGAINLEEARRRAIENRTAAVEQYYHLRQVNAEYRDAQRRPQLSQEQLHRIAAEATPPRLNAYQYEPALGRVYWPNILQNDAFAAERHAIDEAMAKRTVSNSGVGSESYRQIDAMTREMEETLKANIDNVSTSEYLSGKKFLQSLRYEARFAPGADGLVSN